MASLNVSIVGGSGFVGKELLRLLLAHPNVKVGAVTSRENKGRPIAETHSSLLGLSDLKFSEFSPASIEPGVVFLALGHGESMDFVKQLSQTESYRRGDLKVIDLGADFRLSVKDFEKTYGQKHSCPELLEEAVYGVPELDSKRVAQARIIANPGCFAHCITLSLAPLAKAGLLPERIKVAAITGSSGSGAKPGDKTHHPLRNDTVFAYSTLTHRHVPEIEAALTRTGGDSTKIDLVPFSGPLTRGIFSTAFVSLSDSTVNAETIYREFSKENRFVRYRVESPKLLDVRGSNFFDVSVTQQGGELAVLGALDNMVKGAAGNAVQCMNLMSGFSEQSGLISAPLCP